MRSRSVGARPGVHGLEANKCVGSILLSIEFQQTGYLVHRVYKASYGDASGTSTLGGTHQLPVPIVRLNEFLSTHSGIGRGVIVGQTGWSRCWRITSKPFAGSLCNGRGSLRRLRRR